VKRYPAIDDRLKAFVEAQPVYFVGTASEGARINVSPKGIDSFRVLGPNRVAYADMTGATNEAAGHLQRDGRITSCSARSPARRTSSGSMGRAKSFFPAIGLGANWRSGCRNRRARASSSTWP